MNPKELDIQKRIIEAKYIPVIRSIFKQMNRDAVTIYKAAGDIPASIASNYTLEFKKVIRDIMRQSINKFGFSEREKRGIKHLRDFETKDNDQINNDFAMAAISFVATESDRQALYIQDTNVKQLSEAQQNSIIQAAKQSAKLQERINKLKSELAIVSFRDQINQTEGDKTRKLLAKITKLQNMLDKLNTKEQISKYLEENLRRKEEARSNLIAEMSVGISSNWAREEEMAILALSLGITFAKRWNGIVDGNQRPTHFRATGQVVNISDYFIVGGYRAKYPHDPSLPMSEKANCRCSVSYS